MPALTTSLPAWFPPWARHLADLFFSDTASLFVLHGNVHDFVRVPQGDGDDFVTLADFLSEQLFGTWDLVLHHDLARGLRPLTDDENRRRPMAQHLTARFGPAATWPRDADAALAAADHLVTEALLEADDARRKALAFIFDYAQYLVPAGDLGALTRGQGTSLVRLLGWAQNPYIRDNKIAFCLIADRLSEVNDRLVQSPHVATVEVPLPDRGERERFVRGRGGVSEMSPEQIADLANGLSLLNLEALLAQSRHLGKKVDAAGFRALKKTMIERQCRGLLEFVEPKHTLDLVVGQEAAKERLRQDADLLTKGRLDAAPMGYLLCGPVGTGKTFLAECYAGSVGIPCVTLRNFRSKYVGETEGNLEQVLTVLRSLGPTVVVIDEADAALGTRSAEGDSGTSARVFSMIAAQMGDTRYRGRIVWMLLTSRPDYLPIDLKRQGRAEVHIPLFYPQSDAEVRAMVRVMARKNKVPLPEGDLPEFAADRHLSGSDIESVVLAARRRALAAGREAVTSDDLSEAFGNFLPSAQGAEKEAQELAAVLECTELHFLPPDWRAQVAESDGRVRLQERLAALRRLVRE